MCSAFAPIAQTKQPDSCVCSVSAQLEDDEEKSCSDHAAEHQDRIYVDRDELPDLEVHDWLHLHAPAAWRRSTPNRSCSSSSVEGAATMSTVEVVGQLQLGARSSKIAPEMLWLASSSVAQTGSAATTGAIAAGLPRRSLRHCARGSTICEHTAVLLKGKGWRWLARLPGQ